MKKTKKVLLIIIAVITFTIYKNVFAIDACTNSEMERLRELANNVEFKTNYDFDIVDKDMKKIYLNYTIEFINLDDDLKISYKVNNGETIELEPGVKSIKNLGPDNKITISIYSYTDNLCTERLLRTKTINLLPYNDYYYFNKEKCQEYPEFEYCQEFIENYKTYDQIEKLLADYEKEEQEEKQEIKKDNLYKYIIIGVGAIVIIIIIILIVKKVQKMKQEDF